MGTPRKHAELIKAWADGAEIEYRIKGSTHWCVIVTPYWEYDAEYRIKPQPTFGYVNIYSDGHSSSMYESRTLANNSARPGRIACIRITYTEGQFDE